MESFSSKIRIKARMPTLTTFILDITGSPRRALGKLKKKERKAIQVRKEEVKLFLFTEDIVFLCLKDVTKKLLELIKEFSKAVGYKVNAQKLITFLYTSNEQAATRILKDITIYISIQKILNRYKSNKIYTNLCKENYKTPIKEITEE